MITTTKPLRLRPTFLPRSTRACHPGLRRLVIGGAVVIMVASALSLLAAPSDAGLLPLVGLLAGTALVLGVDRGFYVEMTDDSVTRRFLWRSRTLPMDEITFELHGWGPFAVPVAIQRDRKVVLWPIARQFGMLAPASPVVERVAAQCGFAVEDW